MQDQRKLSNAIMYIPFFTVLVVVRLINHFKISPILASVILWVDMLLVIGCCIYMLMYNKTRLNRDQYYHLKVCVCLLIIMLIFHLVVTFHYGLTKWE